MKIVPRKEDVFLNADTEFKLEDNPIGVVKGLVVISQAEKRRLISAAKMLWERLSKASYAEKFIGAIRFDLVPRLSREVVPSSWQGNPSFNLGPMKISGVYEVNCHGIECAAADRAMRSQVEWVGSCKPDAAAILGRSIKHMFEDKKIAFVVGDGPVKRAWGETYLNGLCQAGVNLEVMTPEEVATYHPEIVYRFGDARDEGYSEYPQWFTNFLRSYPGTVFNTVPPKGNDVSSKARLMPCGDRSWDKLVGDNFLLSSREAATRTLKERERRVIKPVRGASGRDVWLGRLLEPAQWKAKVEEAQKAGNYGSYEARWLPRVDLGNLGEYALDINPAFWIEGKLQELMYTVVRIDRWDRYWSRGTINVARGAGYAGTVVVDGDGD